LLVKGLSSDFSSKAFKHSCHQEGDLLTTGQGHLMAIQQKFLPQFIHEVSEHQFGFNTVAEYLEFGQVKSI